MPPLVSICVPCHNAGPHLSAALESLLGQTYSNVEIIAVNDSSTDDTGDILEKYRKSAGIQVHHTQFGNASKTRNFAFEHSGGELVKYFDADDILSPDLIALQVERLTSEMDSIASCRWKRFIVDIDEREFAPDGTWADLDAVDWLTESIRDGGHHAMMQCGMFLIPRTTIERLGGWDERLTLIDDTEFFGRMIAGSRRVLFTTGALYYRSCIPGSLSSRKSRAAYESAVHSVNGFCDHLLSREDSSRTRQAAADFCQAYSYEIEPAAPDLALALSRRAQELGGSAVRPSGGPVYQMLSRLVGWKMASRLRQLGKRLGYENRAVRSGANVPRATVEKSC